MDSENVLKTGTTTVGLVCKDGLVMAADRRATAGYLIANKDAKKVFAINDRMALTIAGTVSDAQLLTKLIKAEIKLKGIRTSRDILVKEAANLLGGLVYGNVRRFSIIPGISHFILGGVDSEGFHLYDIFADGSVTEVKDFVSSGSGSVLVYGLLESYYDAGMNVKDGLELAIKSVNSAMQRDIASGNGIDAVTILRDGVKVVFGKETNTRISLK